MVNALLALTLAPSLVSASPFGWANWGNWGGGGAWDWWKPRLTPEAYQKELTLNGLLTHSRALAKFAALNGDNRAFGTKGYNESADYVEWIAKNSGLDVYRQTVIYPASSIFSNSLVVEETNITNLTTFQYSAGTPPEGVTAPLVLIPQLGCTAADYAAVSPAGKIAFVKRGNCTFIEKAQLAKAADVAGVVIFNNLPGGPVASRIDSNYSANPPTLSLALESAEPIVARLNVSEPEEVVATLQISVLNEQRPGDNVIAQTKWGDQEKVVFVGAHLDSVPAGPGINDDGSGTGTLAELVKQISRFRSAKNAVRFAWWSTEEVGLVGSKYYVEHLSQEERAKILVYINLDMTASPNYNTPPRLALIGIHDGDNSTGTNDAPSPAGGLALEVLFQNHYDSKGLPHTAYAFTSGSDYRGFLDAGIPAGGVATGAGGLKTAYEAELFGGEEGVAYDECYHRLCDDIDNLAHDAYVWNAHAVADVIAQLANDASPIEEEQALAARGISRMAKREPGQEDYVSYLGHVCNQPHDEL